MPGLLPADQDPGLTEADRRWLARALELAARADHATSPNPMVGAVVLDSAGRLAGEGFHERPGGSHAEVLALAAAGARARGGTVYVNLEPCAHHGRTPPCADALLGAGVARVVVSMLDPDSRARGRGIEKLRAGGAQVLVGGAGIEALRLNEFYVKQRTTGRPFVTAKFAISLDGKLATGLGESRWITGEEARAHGHRLRHQHDAILVGVGTVLADDPELTARFQGARQPLRVIADSHLRTPAGARALGENALVATVEPAGRSGWGGAEVVTVPAGPGGRVDLAALLDLLGSRGVLSVLAEGGSAIHGDLFGRGLVDRVHAYVAPRIIGGVSAPGPVGDPGVTRLDEATALDGFEVTPLGRDLLLTGYVHRDS